MIERIATRELLKPEALQPSHPDLKIIGVFNPAAIRFKNDIILLARVAEAAREERSGWLASPRLIGFKSKQPDYAIDWFVKLHHQTDPRKFETEGGLTRLTSVSHFALIRLTPDGQTVQSINQIPDLFGHGSHENFGIEDPRIVEINDIFYITYTAVSDETGVAVSLLSTQDFTSFHRHGLIFASENKDVTLIPAQTNGLFGALHRPVGDTRVNPLAIWYADSPDLIHWGNHHILNIPSINSKHHTTRRIGTGAPPLLTDHGWLLLYHEVIADSTHSIGTYVMGAVLLERERPWHVLAQTREWLATPELAFEQTGFTPQTVFPTGLIRDTTNPDHLLIFYGAADTSVGVMTLSLEAIMANLKSI